MLLSCPCRRTMPGPVRTHRHPGRGSPVLSHPATVPSQMPLRRVVSQSETISAPGQYETLESHPEALRLAYSASGPLTDTQHVEARQDTRCGVAEQPFTPVVVTSPGVAILTALTRQKSHHAEPNFEAKEIGCYRVRGRGRGCDSAHAPEDPARPSSP